jgi:hypothetical protein
VIPPRRAYPWRVYIALVIAGTVGALLVVPYQLALQPSVLERFPLPLILVSAIINTGLLLALAVGLGIAAAERTGLRYDAIYALVYGGDSRAAFVRSRPLEAIALGVLAAVVIVALDLAYATALGPPGGPATPRPGPLAGFIASFYGGITEELLTRLGLMSLLVFLLTRLRVAFAFPIAIGLAALLFAAGHLPAAAAIAPLTATAVARVLVLNAIGGVVFGWLFWRRGLEAAMIGHFSADLVLHVLAG